MRFSNTALFFSGLLLFIFGMNCECEEGGGLEQGAPKIDNYFIGGDENPPSSIGDYADTPESGEISVDFGLTDVDTINKKYLFLHNSGKSDLVLSDVTITEGSSVDFLVLCNASGQYSQCPPDASGTISAISGTDMIIQLGYAPKDLGPDEGTAVLSLNASTHKTLTIHMTGEGVTPEIQVCITDCTGDQTGTDCASAQEQCNDDVAPADLSMNFGDADMDTRITRQVIIKNLGDRPLQVTGLNFTSGDYNQFGLDTSGTEIPGVLPAGQTATIKVYYDPGTGGQHTTFLQVISNDVNEREIKIVLNGQGMAPRVCPDPMALDFGNVSTGQSLEKSFTITNCGLLDLELNRLELAANTSSDFTLVSNPAPTTLAAGSSTQVTVKYSPVESGSDSGGVDIFSNDPASDQNSGRTGTVSLLGKSIPRACDIQATPFAVTFGSVVQATTGTVNLVVSNQGTDTCTLNDVQITTNTADNEFGLGQVPSQNTDFEPGDTLIVTVQYTPVDLGHDTGVLTLYGNDKDGNEIKVDLNGDGVDAVSCDLQVSPAAVQFGTTKTNHTASLVVTATNNGLGPCTVTEVGLSHNYMPGFAVGSEFEITAGADGGSFVLAPRGQPNSQHDIEITFSPTTEGLEIGQLWLHTDDDPDFIMQGMACIGPGMQSPMQGDACINLTGRSAASDIEVVPGDLDFGVVTVGCNSPELQVTVYNLGTIALNVADIYIEDPADPNFEIRQAPNTPFSLNGGQSFQVKLRYHPQDTNVHRSALYIVSDASNDDMLIVPLFGRGTNISDQTDVFHQPTEVKSDVLFVVDNSGSMQEEQNALATNFSSFINSAISMNVDFHIGVIATEVNDPETNVGDPGRDIIPGVLIQAPGRPKIITNSTSDIHNAFAQNAEIGTCCSDEQEAGLEAAWMALSEPLVNDPSANAGFLREDAKLYIICLSDEQDQSKGDPDFYVDFFSSIKGFRNPERMAVSAIVGPSPDGCQGAGGSAESGSRYIEVANRTGGIVESICTSDWAQALNNLGIDAFAAIREFPLSRPADESTISVTVNGSAVAKASCSGCADGWTYYPDTNSIFFGDNVVPDRGDTIEVSYTASCNP